MKIVVSGGGTGGHIYPALALIREIQKENESCRIFIYWYTKRIGKYTCSERKDSFSIFIHITGFKRKLSIDNIKTVIRFLTGVKDSKRMLKEFKPDIVIGTGGYVCGPVVYAAAKLKIPTIVHEQNGVRFNK